MNKSFAVEPFEYEGEDEVLVRDHRGPIAAQPRPVARVLSRAVSGHPWLDPRVRYRGVYPAPRPPRRPGWGRFPYLPFPVQAGCSCEPLPPETPDAPLPASLVAVSAPPVPPDQDPQATEHEFAMSPPPRLATLTVAAPGRPRFAYTFTPVDLVWTTRFLTGEAGGTDNLDNAAVVWAMFNRFGLFTHAVYPTFHQFLRAYSTPLQRVLRNSGAARRHMNDPEFVKTGQDYPGTSIPRGQLRRFLELQQRPWAQLPRAAQALATRALQGGVPDPIGNATEFASTTVYFRDRHGKRARLDDATWRAFTQQYAAGKRWTWIGDVAGLNQRNNAFFVDQRIAALPAGAVRVAI